MRWSIWQLWDQSKSGRRQVAMIKRTVLHLLHLAGIAASHTNVNSSNLISTWKPQNRVGSFVILVTILGIAMTISNYKKDKAEIMLTMLSLPSPHEWFLQPVNILFPCTMPSHFCLISPASVWLQLTLFSLWSLRFSNLTSLWNHGVSGCECCCQDLI